MSDNTVARVLNPICYQLSNYLASLVPHNAGCGGIGTTIQVGGANSSVIVVRPPRLGGNLRCFHRILHFADFFVYPVYRVILSGGSCESVCVM